MIVDKRFYDCKHEVVPLDELGDVRLTPETYARWCKTVEDQKFPSECWECWNKKVEVIR